MNPMTGCDRAMVMFNLCLPFLNLLTVVHGQGEESKKAGSDVMWMRLYGQ